MNDQQFLNGWAEFNRRKWNCDAIVKTYKASNSDAYCDSLLFLNNNKKLFLPPLNPYNPTFFHPTPTNKAQKIGSQWHEVSKVFIDSLYEYAGSANFYFPPEITDIRPFLWKGFIADIKYTYYVDLPYSLDHISPSLRNKMKKANTLDYYSVRTDDMEAIHHCLAGTEARKGFSHQLSVKDLLMAQELLGKERFRGYVCYSKDGAPVSASITLVTGDENAIGWISASKSEHLSDGIVQQLQNLEFNDLSEIGIKVFDFYGANIESVSVSKSHWGGSLRAYYGIRLPGYKEVVRAGRDWLALNSKKRMTK
ncbi:hypothetical protein [Paenibacillus sp. YIM B09110]|uniref:hypothetical protein n=1 Tax=Paenibacillus sp. YIM B09110 TaxID=3126102 RepID=UPI00301E38D3